MTPPPDAPPDPADLDVVVVGAGLSGIAAGYHLQTESPGQTYAVLEARGAIGGTWDLFKYPGLRSDSDMQTYGYAFQPWRGARSIADGAEILDYIRSTAVEHGVDRHVRYHRRLTHAAWASETARWTLTVERTDAGETERLTCRFLLMCSGYYSYDHGHAPVFTDRDRFRGPIVHPQFWPPDLDWAGQRVVVIGSGATAVTLVPALARTAAHVTMLQRSPTYVISQPSRDRVVDWLRGHLPERLAYRIARARSVATRLLFYAVSRWQPGRIKRALVRQVERALPGIDVETHFTPRYDPWDERICVVPDEDLFQAIRSGAASVVTDRIERFTETGLRLQSGAELEADLVVTATGLEVHLMGDVQIEVDGVAVAVVDCLVYRGVMLSGVPNLASVFGYTNTSWTLRADLSCEYVCRLLNHLDKKGYGSATPVRDPSMTGSPFLDFSSGYVERARAELPQQGPSGPWRNRQNYVRDAVTMRHAPVDDGVLAFTPAP